MQPSSNISNHEEQIFLSSPQTLQHLRQQLLSIVLQDQQSLQTIENDFQTLFNQYQQYLPFEEDRPHQIPISPDFLRETYCIVKEKSTCIATLVQLSVRMIDCIRDQQLNHYSTLEKSQNQIETLKQQIESLTSRNSFIENDVEYFKQHLRAAESELEHIVNSQNLQDNGDEENFNEKDRQIETLEQQIQKIKGQLQFFKFNIRSKKSMAKFSEISLHPMRSQHSLLSSATNFPTPLSLDIESSKIIERLEAQNQNLRRQLQHLNRISLMNSRQNRQKKITQMEMSLDDGQVNRTSSLSAFQKGVVHDFRQSLESVKSKFDEDYSTPIDAVKLHPLSNQWSTKSFQLHSQIKATKLIYLNQEEDEYPKKNQQTKETQESIKEVDIANNSKMPQKIGVDVAINTDSYELIGEQTKIRRKGENQEKDLFNRFKPFFQNITNFIVDNRVRKSVLKANQSMLIINI